MKDNNKIEFGDFQTPAILAEKMVSILLELNVNPQIIIEPTCGTGEILFEATKRFKAEKSIGIEINPEYVSISENKANTHNNIQIINADIFQSYKAIIPSDNLSKSILFIGNPPWVTNSGIGTIEGSNLPNKSNIKGLRGIDAITGKSNFDIAEYILLKLIEQYNQINSIFAFLCKTIVARNILKHLWNNGIKYKNSSIYPIDTLKYFNASADACFFIIDFRKKVENKTCDVYKSIDDKVLSTVYGYYSSLIIKNINEFKSHNYFGKSDYTWRNGLKHDCSKVMELTIRNNKIYNGFDEEVDVETDLIYPFLKSSDLPKEQMNIRKYVIVTQHYVGEETNNIKYNYPKLWNYLERHSEFLDSRKSSIYKNKPRFSIFSIGEYSFSPYKIAISGLYKKIAFKKIGMYENKPIMVDDTCNFIPCFSQNEADLIYNLLTSDESYAYLNSVIFWDSKRPITTEILNNIDLRKIASNKGIDNSYNTLCYNNKIIKKDDVMQPTLF
jgi:hypothetical protein